MRSSYKAEDVMLLLKDITGMVEPEDTKTRESKIQSGVHYCEMLPKEYVPTKEYEEIYEEMLNLYAEKVGKAVSILSENIYASQKRPVLVSLARAGIPAGILIKHYLETKYTIRVPHYAISIIRGKGIDDNAMKYILERHEGTNLIFVDGWTGKGAIKRQLDEALKDYRCNKQLAVIADPAGVADLYGTSEDLMIPSSCLNSTVSGLLSRTFLREGVIGKEDFHGAVYYGEMKAYDRSYEFIKRVERYFDFFASTTPVEKRKSNGMEDVKQLQQIYGIKDINLIKPGIGESTRVLLRRVPDVVIINETDKASKDLQPIYRLCKEKQIPIQYGHLEHYKVCGIIKNLADA
ncbi:MAG: cysteine protease StiP domain-containing protein [Blautia producta]